MKSLIRGAYGAVLAVVALAAVGLASPPDPYQCSADPVIVSSSSGNPVAPAYHVTLRDLNGYPMPARQVELVFTNSSWRPYDAQDAGTAVDCVAHQVTQNTDGNGVATFLVRAGGFDDGALVQVRGMGLLITSVPARSTDLNGDGITDLRDADRFRQNLVGNRLAPETDFNLDGVTDLRDLEILRAELYSDARGTVCP